MNTMTYKGYTARLDYDDEDKLIVGRILGIRDIVSFHGEAVTELEHAFHEAVDDYLEACAKLGQAPNKPASGKLMLRIPQEVHHAALVAAQASGKSLNQWAAETISKAATR
ncbi:type II toxin-antitoxin system HicB family antitoxin [Halothiobacillus sp.]|jgi:predicted HicB family RNase H-like nuclease|uniref:type II toxin-antitoxin system HicB family antitoxin n=1 Tax=Halothiobacillus sp. TaxID=1891311 RepID=UPI002A693906|nr:type II toxin-antitoxin system HicB family antitoxin [Atribacterota bacterium]